MYSVPPFVGDVSASVMGTIAMASVSSPVLLLFGFFCITLTQSVCEYRVCVCVTIYQEKDYNLPAQAAHTLYVLSHVHTQQMLSAYEYLCTYT